MSRLKLSLARSTDQTRKDSAPQDIAAADTAPKLTTDLTQVEAMPSPALDLQENLRSTWTLPSTAPQMHADAADTRKIPVGWALTAVALSCGAVWACIALVVF
jgi:hypothetical protein